MSKKRCFYQHTYQNTVDHFLPLELGGENDETNYITACRRCNKDKGNQDPEEYCKRVGVKASDVVRYMVTGFLPIHYWDTPHSIRKKEKQQK